MAATIPKTSSTDSGSSTSVESLENITSHEEIQLLRPKKKARHLCSLGTGEAVHVLSYKACYDQIDEFEFVVQVRFWRLSLFFLPSGSSCLTTACFLRLQGLARSLYSMTSAVSDVRVCHPKVGEVVFIVTFVSLR